jgi:hypothetical protein
MAFAIGSSNLSDFIYYIHTRSDFAKNTVAPAAAIWRIEIQEVIISYVDEKLAAG